MKLNDVENLLR